MESTNSVAEGLETKLESWRERLLDLGNRNPLINCRFTDRSSLVEVDTPTTETVWRFLAAESQADSTSMRFPLHRDLVPPPDDWQEFVDDKPPNESETGTSDGDGNKAKLDNAESRFTRRRRREWNPPIDQVRASPRLKPDDLLVDRTDTALDRKLRKLAGDAQLSMSEQGVHSLYAAFGFLKWYESVDSGEQRISPLILVPVTLSRETTSAPWELTEAEDDALDNLCLRQRLWQDFKLELPPLPEISDLEEPGARESFLQGVRRAVAINDRWTVEDRCAVGRFAFPKIAMWQDLDEHRDAVFENGHCRILGGMEGPQGEEPFGPIGDVPASNELDDALAPGEAKTILDCDSSQLEAIAAAREGVSFVLDGPPGTGKSQTIANIIADALSVGRTVLFVSEKIAALEVVKKRLEDRGLGDFCLECHSSKANRRSVLFEMDRCLDLPAEVYKDQTPKLEELAEQRSQLNRYARELHRPREPLGFSPFELFGRISELQAEDAAFRTRCRIPDAVMSSRSSFDSALRLLQRAGDFDELIRNHDQHPWRGCRQTTRSLSMHDDLQHHLGILADRCAQFDALFDPIESFADFDKANVINVEELIQKCRQANEAPDLPAQWLTAPAQTAEAIVQHLAATAAMRSARGTLSVLKDADANSFPIEAASTLAKCMESTTWLEERGNPLGASPEVLRPTANTKIAGLFVELPRTLRERRLAIEFEIRRLEPIAGSLHRVNERLEQWEVQTDIRLPDSNPCGAIHEFGKAIESAAKVGRGKLSWFDAKTQPSIVQLADKATQIANKNDHLAGQLLSFIDRDQILMLCAKTVDFDQIVSLLNSDHVADDPSFEKVRSDTESLKSACHYLNDLDAANHQIAARLGIDAADVPAPPATTGATLEAITQLERSGTVIGGLRSGDDRATLRQVCDDAIADLQDADSIREQFEGRLSHRAFRSSSQPVVSKGTTYSSVWKRWFGGYEKYRIEIADLYTTEVPKGSELLDDIVLLERFHRRQTDVENAAAHWADRLRDDFDAGEIADWQSVRESIEALDQLHQAWPSLADALWPNAVSVTSGDLVNPVKALLESDAAFRQLENEAGVIKDIALNAPSGVSEHLEILANAWETLQQVGEHWALCQQSAKRPIGSIKDLASLTRAVQTYGQRAENLLAGARRYVKWFPDDAEPLQATSWQRMKSGVEVAQTLGRLGVDTRGLQKRWTEERFSTQAELWIETAAELQSLHQDLAEHLNQVLSATENLAEGRKPSGDAPSGSRRTANDTVDSNDVSIAELTDAVGWQHESLTAQLRHCISVIDSLQPDYNPDIDEVATLGKHVEQFIDYRSQLDQSSNLLSAHGVDSVEPEDLQAAQWLALASVDGRLTTFAENVSTNADVRSWVQRAIEQGSQLVDESFIEAREFLESLFPFDQPVGDLRSILESSLKELAKQCEDWKSQTDSFDRWVAFAGWRKDMAAVGFRTLVDELIAGRFEANQTADVVAMQVYRVLFDQLAESHRDFGGFDIDQHERVRERFAQLDRWEIQAAATQIRQYQLGRDDRPSSSFVGADSSELGILQKEISKERKHKPLRRLFAEIPTVLQRIKPCIMMSPLSVSTFLDCDEVRFDLVIFDEASQVFPWDALGAIYRGRQLIVAGDEKQLPPTNFFSRQDAESDDDDDDIGDYESILSLCKSVGMPNKRLRWHYRSRREPLIAFSNKHFYDGDLVTFPSVDDGDGVSFEHVPEGRWVDRKNLPEAGRVVEMIIDHVRNHPDRSLGVIAFNSTHQRAIEDTLYDLRRQRSDIDALFHGGNSFGTVHEDLFIKNLENVQGDERDFIYLSLGYGFNNVGRFNKNFGPINKQHGERRLNVAITRARESLTFVASVRSSDMDLSGSRSEGAHLLKSYLSYAERGVDTLDLAMQEIAGETDSPFEDQVAAALIRRGLQPVSQVGCGGFRIDLALKHPDRPGQFCLAIECDGATYHSSHTARDRDRIRQTILENLGWKIVRIWSTDWVRNPERQIQRVVSAYEESIASSQTAADYPESASDATEDDTDLEPTFVDKPKDQDSRARLSYDSIDEVPGIAIRDAAVYVLTQAGAMTREDLVRQIARELGFRRTGQRIRARVESEIELVIQSGTLKKSGQRIAMAG